MYVLANFITYLKHIMLNILTLSVILIIFRILKVANERKFWKYNHSTHMIEFQHNLLHAIIIMAINECK